MSKAKRADTIRSASDETRLWTDSVYIGGVHDHYGSHSTASDNMYRKLARALLQPLLISTEFQRAGLLLCQRDQKYRKSNFRNAVGVLERIDRQCTDLRVVERGRKVCD